MKKISDIAQEIQARKEKIAELQEQLESKQAAAEAATKQAQAAAEAGDFAEYKSKRAFAQDVQEEIAFLQAQIDRLQRERPDRETVMAAWNETAKAHNTALKKRLAEYSKAKETMLAIYADMIELQRQTIADRNKCAGFIGFNQEEAARAFPFEAIPCNNNASDGVGHTRFNNGRVYDPDLAYYLANDVTRRGVTAQNFFTDQAMNSVISAILDKR